MHADLGLEATRTHACICMFMHACMWCMHASLWRQRPVRMCNDRCMRSVCTLACMRACMYACRFVSKSKCTCMHLHASYACTHTYNIYLLHGGPIARRQRWLSSLTRDSSALAGWMYTTVHAHACMHAAHACVHGIRWVACMHACMQAPAAKTGEHSVPAQIGVYVHLRDTPRGRSFFHICMPMNMFMHACINIFMHACLHIYARMHAWHVCIFACMHICMKYIMLRNVFALACMHAYHRMHADRCVCDAFVVALLPAETPGAPMLECTYICPV